MFTEKYGHCVILNVFKIDIKEDFFFEISPNPPLANSQPIFFF